MKKLFLISLAIFPLMVFGGGHKEHGGKAAKEHGGEAAKEHGEKAAKEH